MTNELITTELRIPEVRSLVAGNVDVSAYQLTVLREAHQRVAARERGLEMVQQQIEEAQRGLDAAIYADVEWQIQYYRNRLSARRGTLTRRRNQVESARKFLSLVEDGYLPIPRIPAVGLHWLRDPLPPEVLETLGQEQLHERFAEFRVVNGQEATDWGVPRTDRRGRPLRVRGRDPILVGICDGEMFPLAWWR